MCWSVVLRVVGVVLHDRETVRGNTLKTFLFWVAGVATFCRLCGVACGVCRGAGVS